MSCATARYWAIHAFTWVNANGDRRSVRYRWKPDAGLRELPAADAATSSPEYLTYELPKRLTDDPTRPWPPDRTEIVAGRLEVTAPVTDQGHWAAQVYDPTRLTGGIELSDDPVLAFRSGAYGVSHDRRSRGD